MARVAASGVRGSGRWLDVSTRVALAVVTIVLLVMLLLLATGFRALIVRSDSMDPAVRVGDVVVAWVVRPDQVAIGDIVTFRDPTRSQQLVTHRVVDVRRDRGEYDFVTRGDANTGEEHWSVDAGGTVGLTVLRIPVVGFLLSWVTLPGVRVVLVLGACLLLGMVALRRIWGG